MRRGALELLRGIIAMESLQRQVRRAQVRLNVQRFLVVLSWCWFATLLAAAVAIAADKY